MSKLIIRYPNNVIKEVEFDQPKYKIGTAPDNDLILENEEVQPHQAEIDTAEGAFSIVDVSENKSTTVNGKKIERVNLNYGDRIAFGPVVGLFYPSKKGAVGERAKLFLYLVAGGFVLILSIVLMFYLTSRRISTVVSQQISGVIPPQEQVQAPPQKVKVKKEKPEKVPAQAVEGPVQPVLEEGPEAPTAAPATGELRLPEVPPEVIRERTAVAIPRGIRKLFFKKRPLLVTETQGPETAGAAELPEPAPKEVPAPAASPAGEAGTVAEAGEPGALAGEESEAVNVGEESAPEKKGFFSRAFSPVARLFGGKRESAAAVGGAAETEETGAGEISPVETPAGTEVAQAPPPGETSKPGSTPAPASRTSSAEMGAEIADVGTEIARVVDPLAGLRKVDIPELKAQGFREKPVYSESELQTFREKELLGGIQLSGVEDNNINPLWEYPAGEAAGAAAGKTAGKASGVSAGVERGLPVTRTGTLGRLDDDKYKDILYGTKNGVLVGLRGNDGSELFARDLGELANPGDRARDRREYAGAFFEPIMGDLNGDGRDEIVIAFEKGNVLSINRNLEQLWVYAGRDRITSPPAFMDVTGDRVGDIIFTTLGMDVVAIDGKTGFELWRFFDASSEIVNSPVGVRINNDSIIDVVFVTVDGFLYAVDGKTGWGLWKGNISGKPAGIPAVGPVGAGKESVIVALGRNGFLSGHDRGGKLLFTYDMNSSFVTGPSLGDVDGDGKLDIVTIDMQGVVRVIEGMTRKEKWRFQSEAGTTLGRLALADVNNDGGMDMLFTTLSGVLTVLDGRSRTVLAVHNIRDFSFTTPLVADLNGDKKLEMVSAGQRGRVSSVQLSEAKVKFLELRKSGWFALNHDGKNTGYSTFFFMEQRN